ncbi:uncharacterized protein LOC141905939 [Tubulanus polymorphus]|uniref:uncharacterized protein LOC141905939 n=1 Tax=Tubulanus polymorphus TaxID=672921 RepID=UPI003DA61B63
MNTGLNVLVTVVVLVGCFQGARALQCYSCSGAYLCATSQSRQKCKPTETCITMHYKKPRRSESVMKGCYDATYCQSKLSSLRRESIYYYGRCCHSDGCNGYTPGEDKLRKCYQCWGQSSCNKATQPKICPTGDYCYTYSYSLSNGGQNTVSGCSRTASACQSKLTNYRSKPGYSGKCCATNGCNRPPGFSGSGYRLKAPVFLVSLLLFMSMCMY